MPWVTIVRSMIASACLTLAAIYWLVWYRSRAAWAPLLFSLTAEHKKGGGAAFRFTLPVAEEAAAG